MEWLKGIGLLNNIGFLWFINLIVAIDIIFKKKKRPISTWAWTLILLLLPAVGFIIYWLFGREFKNKEQGATQSFHPRTKEQFKEQLAASQQREWLSQSEELHNFQELIYMHLHSADAPLAQHNNVQLYTDGKEKFDAFMHDIEKAEDHIHLQYYIVRNDHLGNKLVNLLAKKAKEGVEVRFLYDAMGSLMTKKTLFNPLTKNGGHVKPFFPVWHGLFKPYINHRNHRKVAIIDGKTAYIGGFNVGDEYLGMKVKFGYWRDTHLSLQGEAAHLIQSSFIADWNRTGEKNKLALEDRFFPSLSKQGNVAMQVVSSGPEKEWNQIKHGFLEMIDHAKNYIYIQTPYFIPDEGILDSLQVAALRGVDVRIMVPNKPDHAFVYSATHAYVNQLMQAGATAYVYENGFLHSKTFVADDSITTVGSSNVDVRSVSLNFEINAFIYDRETAVQLREAFEKDMETATRFTKEEYEKRPVYTRFKESISRLVAPLL